MYNDKSVNAIKSRVLYCVKLTAANVAWSMSAITCIGKSPAPLFSSTSCPFLTLSFTVLPFSTTCKIARSKNNYEIYKKRYWYFTVGISVGRY